MVCCRSLYCDGNGVSVSVDDCHIPKARGVDLFQITFSAVGKLLAE